MKQFIANSYNCTQAFNSPMVSVLARSVYATQLFWDVCMLVHVEINPSAAHGTRKTVHKMFGERKIRQKKKNVWTHSKSSDMLYEGTKKKRTYYKSIHRYSRSVKEFTAPVFFQIRSTNNPKQRLKNKKTVYGRRRMSLVQVWQSPEVWHIVVLSTSVLFEWVHYMSLSQDGIRPRPRSCPSPRWPPLSGTRARHAGKFSKKFCSISSYVQRWTENCSAKKEKKIPLISSSSAPLLRFTPSSRLGYRC